MNFLEVARLDDLPAGRGTTVTAASKEIAIYNVEGTVYAMDDTCLHQGASLGWGVLDAKIVTCRAHGMRYDVTTGKVIGAGDFGVATYPVKIEDGKIFVCPE